jgi:hypothetical protein
MGNITDGVLDDNASSLIWSRAGASGNAQLNPGSRKVEAMKLDSNTNLIFQRPSILTVKQEIRFWREGGGYADNGCSFCHQSEACLVSWTKALEALQ